MNEKREQPLFVLTEQGAVYSKSVLGFSGLYCTLSTQTQLHCFKGYKKLVNLSIFSLTNEAGRPQRP